MPGSRRRTLSGRRFFFDLLPRDRYIESGIWTFHLIPEKIVLGSYQLYLPTQQSRSADTRFVRPDPLLTMTIPSTAQKVISVGAIHPYYEAYADFFGKRRENKQGKPPDVCGLQAGSGSAGCRSFSFRHRRGAHSA